MTHTFRVTCNACGSVFEPKLVVCPEPGGGERQEFTCWKCGSVYPVAVISAEGIRLRARLAELEAATLPNAHLIQRTKAALAREVRRPEDSV